MDLGRVGIEVKTRRVQRQSPDSDGVMKCVDLEAWNKPGPSFSEHIVFLRCCFIPGTRREQGLSPILVQNMPGLKSVLAPPFSDLPALTLEAFRGALGVCPFL